MILFAACMYTTGFVLNLQIDLQDFTLAKNTEKGWYTILFTTSKFLLSQGWVGGKSHAHF